VTRFLVFLPMFQEPKLRVEGILERGSLVCGKGLPETNYIMSTIHQLEAAKLLLLILLGTFKFHPTPPIPKHQISSQLSEQTRKQISFIRQGKPSHQSQKPGFSPFCRSSVGRQLAHFLPKNHLRRSPSYFLTMFQNSVLQPQPTHTTVIRRSSLTTT